MPVPERWLSPHELRVRRRARLWCALWIVLGLVILTLLDHTLARSLRVDSPAALARRDWYQALRQVGFWPTWVALGAAFILSDGAFRGRGLAAWHRGLMVIASSGLAGLFAEVLKESVRRHRPFGADTYTFDWGAAASWNLPPGFVSSHAAVAFGGAIMLGWFLPGAKWWLLALAAGCGLTRLLAGAHYATDVYLAAVLSYGVCHVLWRVFSKFPGGADAA